MGRLWRRSGRFGAGVALLRGVRGLALATGAAAGSQAVLAQTAGVTAGLTAPIVPSQIAPALPLPQVPVRPAESLPRAPAASPAPSPGDDLPLDLTGVDLLGVDSPGAELAGRDPVLGRAHAALDRAVRHRVRTLSGLFAAALALEQAYGAAGYPLVRVAVPPQRLVPGGRAQVVVIDGFVESADVSAVPPRFRRRVAARLAPLIGRRHLRAARLERAVLLAGEVAGISLRSALAPGSTGGATRLVVSGTAERWQGRLGGDNRLPAALGRWQWTASAIANDLLGLGEQSYLALGAQADLARSGLASPRFGLIGGGTRLPLGPGGLTLGASLLLARTEPEPVPRVPRTVGTFARAGLDLGAALHRRRGQALDLRLGLERIVQSTAAPDFATLLSRDRYAVLRLGLTWRQQDRAGQRVLALTLSHGLAARAGTALVPVSRDGAHGGFTTLQASARLTRSLPAGFALDLQARAQTGFGRAQFLSEQFALDAENAVSSFPGGSFNDDAGATLRGEWLLPPQRLGASLGLAPYLFAAGGAGTLARPTAAEQPVLRAAALGLGLRVTAGRPDGAGPGLQLGIELGRGFSNLPARRGDTRAAVSAALRL